MTLPREVDSIPLISSPVADDQKSPVRVELDNQRLLVMVSTVKLHASIPSLSFVSFSCHRYVASFVGFIVSSILGTSAFQKAICSGRILYLTVKLGIRYSSDTLQCHMCTGAKLYLPTLDYLDFFNAREERKIF